jgi:catechol 2,3-dioxygenase-like lactoylglutathione lyase family enzyme
VTPEFDHVTIVVTDLDEATRFFGLLGFEVSVAVVIAGGEMDRYMGVSHLEADHVTLAIPNAEPHQEIQLLRYRHPDVLVDDGAGDLARTGFNHVCFRVPDLDEAAEQLAGGGFHPRNDMMTFHDRKLVFYAGPGNVVVELAEWV